MNLIVRVLLAAAAVVAAVLVGREANNFVVVQGMVALAIFVAAIAAFVFLRRRR